MDKPWGSVELQATLELLVHKDVIREQPPPSVQAGWCVLRVEES